MKGRTATMASGRAVIAAAKRYKKVVQACEWPYPARMKLFAALEKLEKSRRKP